MLCVNLPRSIVTDLEMTMKRKFRNNGNNLITATRPQYIKTKGTVEEESRIIKGNSFKKSINLYFRKSKTDKIRWEKKCNLE